MSEKEAKKIIVISHTPYSFRFCQKGMGEVQNSAKLKKLLDQSGFSTSKVHDCFQLFGGGKRVKKEITKIAHLNHQLAELGFDPIEEWGSKEARLLHEKIAAEVLACNGEAVTLALAWRDQVSALIAAGVHRLAPFIAKYYLPRVGIDFFWSKIWNRSDLIVTECLYNIFCGVIAGISPQKMLYLPHHYPKEADHLYQLDDARLKKMRESYVRKLEEKNQKRVYFDRNTLLVGIVSRIYEGKNIEYTIKAFEEIAKKGINALLILKGGYDQLIEGSASYKKKMRTLFARVEKTPWFLWDREYEPFPKVLKTYRLFDVNVMQSSVEGASNVLVELTALGRPCLVLKEHSNPFLFEGGVEWVEPDHLLQTTWRSPRIPNQKELRSKLEELLLCSEKRVYLGKIAREMATARFAPERTLERIPLLLGAAYSFFHKDSKQAFYQNEIFKLFQSDLKNYQISSDLTVDEILRTQYVGFEPPAAMPKIAESTLRFFHPR